MKVLVHLNHGVDKSYLLAFRREDITKDELKSLIDGDAKAVDKLFIKATQRVEISPKDLPKAGRTADFVISHHGYTAERLG